jgi:hypothetical protein
MSDPTAPLTPVAQPPMTFRLWIVDTAEMAASTIVQAAIVFFLAAERLDTSQGKALLAALLPGAVNVLKQAFAKWMPKQTFWLADMAIRAFWTFAIVALGALPAAGLDLIEITAWRVAALAGLAAALAVVKATIASLIPNTVSPASLAPSNFATAA